MSYKASDWYWTANDGRIFSSARQTVIQPSDATYVSWLATPGHFATVWPKDDTGIQSAAALQDVLTPYGLYVDPVTALMAYAEAKQLQVLAALAVTYTLKDGTATLTTMCDSGSMTFLNSLAGWATMNATTSPVPTRVYYNLDGGAKTLTPTQMAEFLSYVGTRVQATFDAVAAVRSAIGAASPTITTTAQVDAWNWPTA